MWKYKYQKNKLAAALFQISNKFYSHTIWRHFFLKCTQGTWFLDANNNLRPVSTARKAVGSCGWVWHDHWEGTGRQQPRWLWGEGGRGPGRAVLPLPHTQLGLHTALGPSAPTPGTVRTKGPSWATAASAAQLCSQDRGQAARAHLLRGCCRLRGPGA